MEVCPTYCILHLVQVMQYMRLELLHETNFMHLYCFPVVVLVMNPVLLILGQYLQTVARTDLQNLKPLLEGSVPSLGWYPGASEAIAPEVPGSTSPGDCG